MNLTSREIWTAIHGMVLGAGFLILFSGGFVSICGLGCASTPDLARRRIRWTALCLWGMAALAWLTVLLGTYVVYPWYRAKAPTGASGAALMGYPKYFLLSNPQTEDWHELGMEWKEHIAWLVPILTSAVACLVSCHGQQLTRDARLRRVTLALFSIAFFCASIAGLFGALINKAAPTR